MSGNGRYSAQDFIAAIPGTGGIITKIAERVGCHWHTAKTWCTTKPTVKRALDAERESILDLAESNIITDLRDGVVQTSKWYLGMKGAERGYKPTERKELAGDKDNPITVRAVDGDLLDGI